MKEKLIVCMVALLMLLGCKSSQTADSESKTETKRFKEESFDPFFKGLGTEPFWSVAVDRNFIVYTNVEGMKEIFPVTGFTGTGDKGPRILTSRNAGYEIRLSVVKGKCSDGMSDQVFDYEVAVSLTGKGPAIQQKGCGNYQVTKGMEGKWELSFFKDKEIPDNRFLKTPYVEFGSEGKHVSGNASCNGFNGTVTLNDSTMQFSKFAVTRMMCVHENMEQEFLSELSKVTAYEITAEGLNMYSGNTLTMKFRKK